MQCQAVHEPFFYFESPCITGTSTWERPVAPAAAAAPAPSPAVADAPLFIQSKEFIGARPGYVFRAGPAGNGYYKDDPSTDRLLGRSRWRLQTEEEFVALLLH